MTSPTSRYDIESIRKKMATKIDGRRADPFEFRPPKAKADEVLKYRFYVLPELNKGDKVHTGTASRDMEMFAVKHGQHWINNRPHACPRLFSDEECEMCQAGFDALAEIPKSEKEKRAAIVKQWLASSTFAVNIYFPPIDPNPEDVRGTVRWFNSPKQVFDIWYAAISRDDSGDPDDPEAYGVFYDPYNAFLFQLVIKRSGDFNEYKSSKFIAQIGAGPIARLDGKKPDDAAIQRILDSRHDLYNKLDTPNPQEIHKLCVQMMHGADAAGEEIVPTTPEDVERPARGKRLPEVPDEDDDLAPAKPAAKAPITEAPDDEAPAKPAKPAAKPASEALADEAPVTSKPAKAPVTQVASKPAKAPATQVASKPAPAPAKAKAPAANKPAPAVEVMGQSGDNDDDDIKGILAGLNKDEDEDS